MKYIVLDPSGNFEDGKGHTGIATLHDDDWSTLDAKTIYANHFETRHEYWKSIFQTLVSETCSSEPCKIIIESFMIRNNGFLIGKMPETIRLIGFLEYGLEELKVDYSFQTPSQAKVRFKDIDLLRCIPCLEYKASTRRYYLNGRICSDHVRDALKHLLYYKRYKEAKP